MSHTVTVSIAVSELSVSASLLAPEVRQAAEAQGGTEVEVVASDDGADLTVVFVLDVEDDEDARRRGDLVLDAVAATDCVWQVAVTRPFTT